jgi:hypothetical protein
MSKKAKQQIQDAIKIIRKYASSKFHVKESDFRLLSKIKDFELSSVQLGEYSAKSLNIGSSNVSAWVNKAMQHTKWPCDVKYKNGVLFIEESSPEAIQFVGDLMMETREVVEDLEIPDFDFDDLEIEE